MQKPDRLTEIVNQISIGLPRQFKITIFNAEAENSYEFTTSPELVLIQSFAPFFDKLLNKIDKILIQAENDGMDESQIKLGHELVLKTKEFLSKNQIENAKISYADLKKLLYDMGYSINFR